MDRNGDRPSENKQRLCCRLCYNEGASYCHLGFGRYSKADGGVGKHYSGKREGFRYACVEAVGMGEL